MTRQCLQSKRSNKLGRAGRHHDVYGTILLRQLLAISAALHAAIEAVTLRMMFMRAVSFRILDLFADLFQLGFALDDNLGDLGVVCFSAERIQLAAEFLADELKRSPLLHARCALLNGELNKYSGWSPSESSPMKAVAA